MQLHQLMLPAGVARIHNYKTFPQCFAKEIVQYTTVQIPVVHRDLEVIMTPERIPPDQPLYNRKVINLDNKIHHEFDRQDIMEKLGSKVGPMELDGVLNRYCTTVFKEAVLEERLNAYAHEKLKSMIVRKTPSFLVGDLTMKSITDLSIEYTKKFNSTNIVATEFFISKYQKYFILAAEDAFKYYMLEPVLNRRMDKDCYEALTKAEFVEMSPDKWVIGKYENPTYITELNASMRYGPHFLDTEEEDK